MKFYQIALFIFALNASFSILNSINLFGSYIQHDPGWMQQLNQSFKDQSSYQISTTAIFGDFAKGLSIVIEALGNATILLPFFLAKLGAPAELNAVITAGTWLTYGIAIAQFLAGRYIEK